MKLRILVTVSSETGKAADWVYFEKVLEVPAIFPKMPIFAPKGAGILRLVDDPVWDPDAAEFNASATLVSDTRPEYIDQWVAAGWVRLVRQQHGKYSK